MCEFRELIEFGMNGLKKDLIDYMESKVAVFAWMDAYVGQIRIE